MILAIDTSGPFCSAAFLDCASRQIIAQKSDDIGRGHAELLLPMIEGLMETESLRWSDVKAVGCTTGPGSFTGLRVGLAAAKGFGFALSCPCLGVSVFEAFAYDADMPMSVILNAKREEYWLQSFDPNLQNQDGPKAVPADSALHNIPSHIKNLSGSGAKDMQALDTRFHILDDAPSPNIKAVAQLTSERMSYADQYPAKPLYLRAPDAKPQTNFVVAN
jgi:tRNA threonylcarbamoyladenosine biosynthesis protein TsaB